MWICKVCNLISHLRSLLPISNRSKCTFLYIFREAIIRFLFVKPLALKNVGKLYAIKPSRTVHKISGIIPKD